VVPRETVLIVAGFQVPVMEGVLFELIGKGGGVLFKHNGPICEKEVVLFGRTVTVKEA